MDSPTAFTPFTHLISTVEYGVFIMLANPETLKRIRKLILKELTFFQEKKCLAASASIKQKNNLAGQLILSHENLLTQMLGMAADLLDFGKAYSLSPEYIESIESITSRPNPGSCQTDFW